MALFAYFTFCILAIIADVLRNETLKLISVPFIIPALFFYYITETKKINILLCLFLIFSFIGESIGIMNFDGEVFYLIFPFLICNLVLIVLILKHIEKFKFKLFNISLILICALVLIYFWFSVIDLFIFHETIVRIMIGVFGALLILLSILSGYNTIWCMNISNLWMSIAVICILISDAFYIIYNFQLQLILLDVLHFMGQILSYFFVVKYVLSLKESKAILYS